MNTDEFSLRLALEVIRGNRTPPVEADDIVETEFGSYELNAMAKPTIVELLKMAREFL